MKFINIKYLRKKHTIYNIGYLKNGNLACLLYTHFAISLNSSYQVFDIIGKKFVNDATGYNFLPYNRINNYLNPKEKLFNYGRYQVSLSYILKLESDTVPGTRNLVVDTDYGFAGIIEVKSQIEPNDISKIVFLKDKKAIESDFKFPLGKFHNFHPSPTEVGKFLFLHSPKSSHEMELRNHNNNHITCGRYPICIDYSPDNKNVALALRENSKRSSNKLIMLDAETLQVKFKMEVPLFFNKLTFSQDGNKLALISNYQILEIDID